MDSTKKKIFLTGESGTIAKAIDFYANRYNCVVVNNQDNFATLKHHKGFECREPEVDILGKNTLDRIFNTVAIDYVVHAAAFVGSDFCDLRPNNAIDVNIQGTLNIVELCNKYNIPIIYLSTTAIFDPRDYTSENPITENTRINPQTLYGITKYAGELIIRNQCKSSYLILRPVFGFGNFPDDLHSALTKVIYTVYENIFRKTGKLNVLLGRCIKKSYTRVENFANCILKIVDDIDLDGLTTRCLNMGEHYIDSSYNWENLFEIISNVLVVKHSFNKQLIKDIFYSRVYFISEQDYLHTHVIDNYLLRRFVGDFNKIPNYISLEQGIEMTVESVMRNANKVKPYWLE